MTNDTHYVNPFADVTLNTIFTAPSGRQVEFFGFYDGDGLGGQSGNVWKFRFMPDEPGTWTYTASFSDGQRGKNGRFIAVLNGAKPGPLKVDPDNPRWFIHANGQQFYVRGYYYSEAFSATDAFWQSDLDTYFGPHSKWKFNFATTTYWQGGLLAENNWNARPYNGFYPVVPGDVTRFDLSAWHHVDEVLQYMESLNTIWYNFDGFIPNVGGDRPQNLVEEQVMLRNWVARIAPYWNITWNIAFEWEEFMDAENVNRIARFVKSIDPWNHLMTVHNHGIGTEPKNSDDWLDFYSIQYDEGKARDASIGNTVVTNANSKPVFAQEVIWEADNKLNAEEVRNSGWGIITGAGLLNYAEHFQQSNTTAYGDGGGFPYIKIMLDTIEELPFWLMRPRNDLVRSGRKAYCLAKNGAYYLVYLPKGGTVRLDLTVVENMFDATWLNPRNGKRGPSLTVKGGKHLLLDAPTESNWLDWLLNSDRDNDWALMVTAR